jgi:hypothetical protein
LEVKSLSLLSSVLCHRLHKNSQAVSQQMNKSDKSKPKVRGSVCWKSNIISTVVLQARKLHNRNTGCKQWPDHSLAGLPVPALLARKRVKKNYHVPFSLHRRNVWVVPLWWNPLQLRSWLVLLQRLLCLPVHTNAVEWGHSVNKMFAALCNGTSVYICILASAS